MLKKKTLTETVYNNSDPFQIRKAIDACIGSWQKQEKYQVLWDSLTFETDKEDFFLYNGVAARMYFRISVEAVYDDSVA